MSITTVVQSFFAEVGYNGYDWYLRSERLSTRIASVARVAPDGVITRFQRRIITTLINERLGMRLLVTDCKPNCDNFENDIAILLESNNTKQLIETSLKYFDKVTIDLNIALTNSSTPRLEFALSRFPSLVHYHENILDVYTQFDNSRLLRETHTIFILKQLDLQGCGLVDMKRISSHIDTLTDDDCLKNMQLTQIRIREREIQFTCFDDITLRKLISEAVMTYLMSKL